MKKIIIALIIGLLFYSQALALTNVQKKEVFEWIAKERFEQEEIDKTQGIKKVLEVRLQEQIDNIRFSHGMREMLWAKVELLNVKPKWVRDKKVCILYKIYTAIEKNDGRVIGDGGKEIYWVGKYKITVPKKFSDWTYETIEEKKADWLDEWWK